MLWSELDLDAALWTIGKDRTRNGLAHEVHFRSPLRRSCAQSHVATVGLHFQPPIAGPFQSWSRMPRRRSTNGLTKAIPRKRRSLKSKLKAWHRADLQGSAATRLVDLGTQRHVIEAILNHVPEYRAGVAKIYNRATYSAEKREALNRWRSPFRIAPRARLQSKWSRNQVTQSARRDGRRRRRIEHCSTDRW